MSVPTADVEKPPSAKPPFAGWPRFGSVRLRFGDGTVRAVPVFGSGGSSKEGGFFCISVQSHREDGSGSGFPKDPTILKILWS